MLKAIRSSALLLAVVGPASCWVPPTERPLTAPGAADGCGFGEVIPVLSIDPSTGLFRDGGVFVGHWPSPDGGTGCPPDFSDARVLCGSETQGHPLRCSSIGLSCWYPERGDGLSNGHFADALLACQARDPWGQPSDAGYWSCAQ